MMLGHCTAPDLPRAIFRSVMSPMLDARRADEVFDSVAHFNRVKFLDTLRLLRTYDGHLVTLLEDAAINQLQALSSAVGARAL